MAFGCTTVRDALGSNVVHLAEKIGELFPFGAVRSSSCEHHKAI